MDGCTLSSDCRAVFHHTKRKDSEIVTSTREKSIQTHLGFLHATSIARLEDMLPLDPEDALISLILTRS
jgi:hypothetical protein